jgi:hypothetical protein
VHISESTDCAESPSQAPEHSVATIEKVTDKKCQKTEPFVPCKIPQNAQKVLQLCPEDRRSIQTQPLSDASPIPQKVELQKSHKVIFEQSYGRTTLVAQVLTPQSHEKQQGRKHSG